MPTVSLASSSWRHLGKVALALGLLAGAAGLGHEGRRALQVFVLGLPLVAWMLWPLQRRLSIRLRAVALQLGLLAFMLDALARTHLREHYQAAPDSALVISATANSSLREISEYLTLQSVSLLPGLVTVLLALGLITWVIGLDLNPPARPARLGRWLMIGLLCLGGVGLASKPWRKHHPLVFWPDWTRQVRDSRLTLSDQAQAREQLQHNAAVAVPVVAHLGPMTVVVVLGDSANRDNMSLYGYPRATTPQLEALQHELGAHLLTVRHAWSTQAGTLASPAHIFGFGRDAQAPVTPESQHVLARAAGYRVWWISNHDDYGIEQQHAKLADVVTMINRQPGRSTTSLDGEVLQHLPDALRDPAARKLIVLHLLGTHPHYRLRRPETWPRFGPDQDGIDAAMSQAGRPVWLRQLRHDYDTAMHYHDWVVAETLRLTRTLAPTQGDAAWMFLSDHGQEVGHSVTRAGHSPHTPAGYRIPLLLWRDGAAFEAARAEQPFRADWAAWTLAELLHLRWPQRLEARDIASAHYAWQPPPLPLDPVRFDN